MTDIETLRLTIPSRMLRRGFWLYVWRVITVAEQELLYVGRTGDNSSPNASPPYIRMGQHLGPIKNQNALRGHLTKRGIIPEECRSFDFVAHGPVHAEVTKPSDYDRSDRAARSALMQSHTPLRNIVGAMEKRLATDLSAVGYTVMNTVKWPSEVEDTKWLPIRRAFAQEFPRLKAIS